MKTIAKNKISRKFFLILLLISFSALTGLTIFQTITNYTEAQRTAKKYQKEQIRYILNEINSSLILIEKMMQLSTHSKGVLESGVNERFRFYLWKILKYNPSVFEVIATDSNGKELILASKIRTETNDNFNDLSQEDYFKEAIKGKTFYSKVMHNFDRTKPYIIISVPIFKFDGTINGVLISKIWLLDIQKMISQTLIGETGFAFITDEQMEIIAHPEYDLVFKHSDIKNEYLGLEKILFNALKNSSVYQHGIFRNRKGNSFLCTAVYLPKFNWIVSVAQSENEIYGSTYRIIISFMIVSTVLFLLIFAVSKKISENIAKPIVKLRELTSFIAQGNFDEKVTVKTNDEIEELANNFNYMSQKLRNVYSDLEKRVEERTKELLLLYSFASAVSKSLYVNETIKTAGEELMAVLEFNGYIFVSQENLNIDDFVTSIPDEESTKKIIDFLTRKGLIQYVIKRHLPFCQDLGEEKLTIELDKIIEINSIGLFPVMYQGNVIGVFVLFNEIKNMFNSNIVSAIETCMIHLGVSIANAQRYEITEELSFKDPLTKLFNRRYFETKLENEFARCQRYGRVSSLCMIDIDHFKKINDTYGHQSGDAILKQLAEIILSSIRKSDVAARYGGEEFIILMTESSPDKAFIAAERIRKKVEEHAFVIDVEPGYIHITISIGIAGLLPYMTTKEDFIEQADRALYTAKQTGRNRVCM